MKKAALSGLLMAVLTLGWVGTAPQVRAEASSACGGVWVVVDFGSLGGTSTECATSYSTGKAALQSANLPPTLDNGMLTQIAGKPSNPDINKYYWSYWHATRKSDGTYSGWSYSNLGATGYHPTKGNAEGWRYQSLADGKVPPASKPPTADTSTPTPTPTKTSSKPTATAKPTATKKPTATTSTRSATPTASATSTATAKRPTATASPQVDSATPTAAPTAAPSVGPAAEVSALGQQQVTDNEPPAGGGSPVGAIVAGGLVLAGGAGIGGWWWLKGRKR